MTDRVTRILWLIYGIAMLILSHIVHQYQFYILAGLYILSFMIYFWMGTHRALQDQVFDDRYLLILKILIVFAFPLASDDIYRFYWDGHSTLAGISPYRYKPIDALTHVPPYVLDIYKHLNSTAYFSVYPPILQFLFACVAALSFKSIYIFAILWKALLFLADQATIKLLHRWLPDGQKHKTFWYAYNPLVLFEVLGNGHPEGLMIYLLMYTFYLLQRQQLHRSALYLGLAAAVKIFPIILTLFFIKYLGLKKSIRFGFIAVGIFVLSILPIGPHYTHFLESIGLYFKSFEFNGSVFEIWKAIDYQRLGYDNIAQIGIYLSRIFIGCCGLIFLTQRHNDLKSLLKSCLFVWTGYLLLSTTVHPWYVIPVLFLGILAEHRWAAIWSCTVVLSYAWYDDRFTIIQRSGFILAEYILILLIPLWINHRSLNKPKLQTFD